MGPHRVYLSASIISDRFVKSLGSIKYEISYEVVQRNSHGCAQPSDTSRKRIRSELSQNEMWTCQLKEGKLY